MNTGVYIFSAFALSLSACGSSQPKSVATDAQTDIQNALISETATVKSQLEYDTLNAISSLTPLSGPCSTPEPDQLYDFINRTITIKDNGKSLVVPVTTRFWFYLDDRIYPLRNLLNAIPDGLIGYVSNGSIRGPQCYPIMFEAVHEGRGFIKIKDFQIFIIVDNNMPESPLPLN